MLGVIKFFNANKGWGFIICDDDHLDYFVHQSNILMDGFRTLVEGQKVSFDKDPNEKDKLCAKNVRIV